MKSPRQVPAIGISGLLVRGCPRTADTIAVRQMARGRCSAVSRISDERLLLDCWHANYN
jgi:hypothetical protein